MERFPVTLPARAGAAAPQNVSGTAFRVAPKLQEYPRPEHGKRGPFKVPARPNAPDFQKFLDYYADLIGSYIELLNAVQFNMQTKQDEAGAAGQMTAVLGSLADALEVGSPGNPKELRWPLAGSYVLQQSNTGFRTFSIELFFECEARHRLVTICEITITTTDNPGQGDSSGNSYVATSSHSP
jgi:hypothetical protein